MNVVIQKLSLEHTSAYRELRLLSYQESPYAFSESYEDEHQKNIDDFKDEIIQDSYPEEYFILGCFDGDKLVAFVKFKRDQRTKARHKAMVYAMYVHPDYRGKGLGKQLMQYILDKCGEMPDMEQIHLWVLHHKRASAANFYKSLGFKSMSKVIADLKVENEYIDAEYMFYYLVRGQK